MQLIKILGIVWAFIIGACIGSFLNVVICRLPEEALLSKVRSHCPACGVKLRWKDLIPVLSWLILRGHCRDCGKKILPRYPLVEAFCAVLTPLCFIYYGFSWRAPLALGVTFILLAIALIDLDTMEIPDSLHIALIPFVIGSVWVWRYEISLVDRGIGLLAVSLPMLITALAVNGAFGGGDIKLMAVCGFLLGWNNIILAFFIALLLGGSYAVYLLINGKRKKGAHIPFGPSLCTGVAISLFFGQEIMRFYLQLYEF